MPTLCKECSNDVGSAKFCNNCGLPNESYAGKKGSKKGEIKKIIFDQHVTVSNKRIDTAHGYCFGNLDTMDFRLITDIGFKRNCLQMVIGRYAPSLDSTITIFAKDETNPEFKIRCFGAKHVFKEIRTMWNNSKTKAIVE